MRPGSGSSRCPRGRARRRAMAVGCLVLVSLAGAGAARSQPAPDDNVLKRGRDSLAAGRAGEALEIFTRGQREAGEGEARLSFVFYRGVAIQQQAKAEARPELLEEAARLYREYLAVSPGSGVVLNNLGRALEDLGRLAPAAECYREASDLRGPRRLFYMENLARVLDRAGNSEEATRVYRDLAREQPLAEAPHRLLMGRYLAAGGEGPAGYLWEILNAGQPERACFGALEALTEAGDGPGEWKSKELLTIVGVGLAGMPYAPADFAGSRAGRLIRDLSERPGMSACAGELLLLHASVPESLVPERYPCWRSNGPKPPGGVEPAEGFRALTRSIGRRYREMGELRGPGAGAPRSMELDLAAGYFRLALDFNRHGDDDQGEVDPVAFTELIRLEMFRDNFGAVEGIAETYERSLFESKSMAYARNQSDMIYQFHASLGELYGVLGIWGDSDRAGSAIFQLEHARKTSAELERKYAGEAAAPQPAGYRFTPEMTDLLATAYEQTGQPSRVLPLRLEQAELYERAGDRMAMAKVMAPVRATIPPQELKPRFEMILRAVDVIPSPPIPGTAVPRTDVLKRLDPVIMVPRRAVP